PGCKSAAVRVRRTTRFRLRREPSSTALDEEARGGFLADRLLVAGEGHAELARGRLGRAQLDNRAGHEPLVVEPVQKVAVVLGEADDRRARAGGELGQRLELAVLQLLDVRVDRPAVRAPVGMAELLL